MAQELFLNFIEMDLIEKMSFFFFQIFVLLAKLKQDISQGGLRANLIKLIGVKSALKWGIFYPVTLTSLKPIS